MTIPVRAGLAVSLGVVLSEPTLATFTLPATAITYWGSASHRWVVEPDQLRLQVGGSSADIRASNLIPVAANKQRRRSRPRSSG